MAQKELSESKEQAQPDLTKYQQRFMHGSTPLQDHTTLSEIVKDTSRFTRLFPNLPAFLPPVEKLIALGEQGGPLDAGKSIPENERNEHLPAGFTFFGQFLDHNITFDAASSLDKPDDPHTTTNFRSGRIDLEHVYGLGPETDAFVYYDKDAVGKFWIDRQRSYDVPRNEQGTAIIGDPRNDNTIITIQIHLAMMKFHNAVVDYIKSRRNDESHSPGSSVEADLFNKAHELVVWHYQWIVLHEWLRLILKQDAYNDIIIKHHLRYYSWKKRPQIPVEFNDAAYRLHTLVLEKYRLNQETVGVLFKLRVPFAPLTEKQAIDWSYFFDFGDDKVQHAKRFEAKISDTFLNMPGPIDNPLEWPFDVPNTQSLRSIAVRNLLRGRAFGLPSGEEVAAYMGYKPLMHEEMPELAKVGLEQAPLWYYVFKEAEVREGGKTLGDVGSRIVGEVFLGLILGDPTSYLNHNLNWKPTLGPDGTFTMTDLLRFAGLHQ